MRAIAMCEAIAPAMEASASSEMRPAGKMAACKVAAKVGSAEAAHSAEMSPKAAKVTASEVTASEVAASDVASPTPERKACCRRQNHTQATDSNNQKPS
ncbi:MAG: hypothetical protein ACLPWS_10740 [Rhodomicrobium sp.]